MLPADRCRSAGTRAVATLPFLALGLLLPACDYPRWAPWGAPVAPAASDVAPTEDPAGATDDDDAADPASCTGLRLTEVVTTDVWGRPLGADVEELAALPDPVGSCVPRGELSCGDVVSGDSSTATGTTQAIDGWPVAVGDYSGREVAWSFVAPGSGGIRWELVDPHPTEANQDLFVLDGAAGCEPGAATARGFNSVSFDAEAGRSYFLVLDSFPGDEGPFSVRLTCEGAAAGGTMGEGAGDQAASSPTDGPVHRTFSAPDYLDATLSAEVVDGSFRDVSVSGTARWAISNEVRPVPGYEGACNVQTLYVGLDHAWYAAQSDRPPREGNEVDLLRSGEDLFAQMHDDFQAAREDIHIATWWWMSDLEMLRPEGHWRMSSEEREESTVLRVLDSLAGVQKKVLVSRFCDDDCGGALDWMTIDAALVERGEEDGDDFEVSMQGNPTEVPLFDEFEAPPVVWSFVRRLEAQPEFEGRAFEPDPVGGDEERFDAPLASWHQKMLAIDGEVAFVGGMNVKSTDWDGAGHEVFDERRMEFGATQDERADVLAKAELPDVDPRKDYAVRLQGPCAADVDGVLRERWDLAITSGEPLSAGATPWEPVQPQPGSDSGVEAQFQVTMPAPMPERSILESLTKAIARAERYVYVEDQYWRAPLLNDALIETLKARPQVKLIVVTAEVLPVDPAAYWTIRTDELFRSEVPDQYVTFTTRSFDWAPDWDPISGDHADAFDVAHSLHSKLVIVDDRYMSVGSANKNNRGLLYEGEANVAILDDGWVREQRQAIWEELVGPRFAAGIGDDDEVNWETLRQAADWNASVVRWWEENASGMTPEQAQDAQATQWPSGFLHPLEMPDWSLIEPGPDAF